MALDHYTLLGEALKPNPVWTDFAATVSRLINNFVDPARIELQNIRDPITTELQYVIKNVANLGFDYNAIGFTDTGYRRLALFYSLYLNQDQGTKRFVDFFGFIKNTRFTIDQLWTADYINFYTYALIPSGGVTIINPATGLANSGGTYYPTSHVQLTYDPETYPITNTSDLIALFYKIAPIQLVLLHVNALVEAEASFGYAAVVHETIYEYALATHA